VSFWAQYRNEPELIELLVESSVESSGGADGKLLMLLLDVVFFVISCGKSSETAVREAMPAVEALTRNGETEESVTSSGCRIRCDWDDEAFEKVSYA
jgi:hypothetical protein